MKTNKLLSMVALGCALTAGFTSCKKDNNDPVIEQEQEQEYNAKVNVKIGETAYLPLISKSGNSEGSISRDGNVYRLRNFRQGTMNAIRTAVVTANPKFYFDFKENDGTDENGPITLPNSTSSANLQVNTSAGYTLSYINKTFDLVVSTDVFILATDGKLGLESSYTPNVIGWVKYTGNPNHQVLPIPDRTFILSKNGKPFFKFKVNSVYSNETMEKESAPSNYFYYSIDYQEFK